MWDEQFAEFAKEYRVIRYDLRGYGASSSQTEDYQFTHVQDLVTLMDSLHIRKAHIVGLSLGGFPNAWHQLSLQVEIYVSREDLANL